MKSNVAKFHSDLSYDDLFPRAKKTIKKLYNNAVRTEGKVAAETGDGEDPDDLPQLYAKKPKPKTKAKTNEAVSFEDDFSEDDYAEEYDRFISDLIEDEYWNDFYYNNYCDLDCFCS